MGSKRNTSNNKYREEPNKGIIGGILIVAVIPQYDIWPRFHWRYTPC